LDDIFKSVPGGDDEKDDGVLYTLDDKSDAEGMTMVEEGGGSVRESSGRANGVKHMGDFEGEEGSDKGDEHDYVGWEDTFEQEV